MGYCCGETWGWIGMGLLLTIRVFQGLSAGGELSTAAVYITEVSPRERLGFNLSWISVTGAFGAWVVSALVVFVAKRRSANNRCCCGDGGCHT